MIAVEPRTGSLSPTVARLVLDFCRDGGKRDVCIYIYMGRGAFLFCHSLNSPIFFISHPNSFLVFFIYIFVCVCVCVCVYVCIHTLSLLSFNLFEALSVLVAEKQDSAIDPLPSWACASLPCIVALGEILFIPFPHYANIYSNP